MWATPLAALTEHHIPGCWLGRCSPSGARRRADNGAPLPGRPADPVGSVLLLEASSRIGADRDKIGEKTMKLTHKSTPARLLSGLCGPGHRGQPWPLLLYIIFFRISTPSPSRRLAVVGIDQFCHPADRGTSSAHRGQGLPQGRGLRPRFQCLGLGVRRRPTCCPTPTPGLVDLGGASAIGGGLLEVIVSPIIDSLPGGR